jgi:hypothetical protein
MYCTELVPKVCFRSSFVTHQLTCLSRCTAPAKGIDDAIYGYRSRGHTDVLVQEFELGVLWDEYGLVGDIIVRISPSRTSAHFVTTDNFFIAIHA